MNVKTSTKITMYRTVACMTILVMLFAALPVTQASAVSLNIASVASGTWEATAWPNTQRSGTITVTAGDVNVTGAGTAFLTELSVGNILKTTGNIQIGTVASIASNTALTLANIPATNRTNIAYHVQGVGPSDNATIANSHNVTIAAKPVNQTGTVTVSTGGTLTISDPGTVFSTLTVNGTVNGTSGNAFGVLTVNNGGLVTAGSNGTYTASSLNIKSGGAMNIMRAFTVNGATTVAGTISFGSTSITARAVVFKGPVTLQSGATWSESVSGNGANNFYEFQNNFTNGAGTFTASDTSIHTFSGTAKTIGGATNTSIARVRITGTYTNNGTLSVGTNLSGTGSLTNGAAGTLNIGGTVSLAALENAGTATKTGAGPITIDIANFTNSGTLNLNGTGTIAGITNNGTVNLNNSGSISAFDNASASSVLNITDLNPVPHFHTLVVSAPGNTVNYSGAGNQTVKPITYSNLIFSGSGTKFITMPNSSTLANANLSIAPTGAANAGITGPNLSVNYLALGGAGKAPGTWGSSASAAANKDDIFFSSLTGYLNVINDARSPQTISFTSTVPVDAVIGGTYIPSATATSGLPVTFTIDPVADSVCSISGGVVSFLTNGTCEINANQDGDENYLAATQQQSFDVKNAQTINFTSTEPVDALVGGATYTPSATATSGLPVTFTIDPAAESICSISAGVVSFDAAGTCVINADQVGDADYHAAPQAQQSFPVLPGATVNLSIGGQTMTSGCTPPNSPYVITAGASQRVSCAGVNNGPVKLESDIDIMAAERVIYKAAGGVNTSFTEMMGLPDGQLDTTYWLPWYNNVDLDTQLRFANVSGATATVHVTVGGVEMTGSPFTLLAGESTRKSFPAINNGPVKIESDVEIVAAERVIYKVNGVNTSFSEMMAMPNAQLDTIYWLPWYNNKDLDTQLRFANVSGATATVHVYVGGVEMTGSPFTLLAGESTRKSFAGVNNGPVQIVSDQNIVAAERLIYKVSNVPTSFSEMMGLPDGQLDTTYWLPWYNNKDLDTQLRFGVP